VSKEGNTPQPPKGYMDVIAMSYQKKEKGKQNKTTLNSPI
jgi:hypothetical protein